MICSKCGNNLLPGSTTCNACGTSINNQNIQNNNQPISYSAPDTSINNMVTMNQQSNQINNMQQVSSNGIMRKVNRVFCYSKEVAKQNGNRLPILELVLTVVAFIILLTISVIIFGSSVVPFIILTMLFMVSLIYFSVLLGNRMKTKTTGWASTDNNGIYKAMTVNNGQGLYLGGLAAGSIIDQMAKNTNGIGSKVGGIVGAAGQIYAMNRQAEYMSHPEIVAKIIELAPNITGAEVYEILKVYSIDNRKHTVNIRCDYRILRTNKIKSNKKLKIEKSYNQFNELINTINMHR